MLGCWQRRSPQTVFIIYKYLFSTTYYFYEIFISQSNVFFWKMYVLNLCLRQVIKPEQPKMICGLCDRMVHTKCAGFNGRTSDDLAKGKNLNYCCDARLVVAN